MKNTIQKKLNEAVERHCWISVMLEGKDDYFQGSVRKTESGYLISGYDDEITVNLSQIKEAYIYGESV